MAKALTALAFLSLIWVAFTAFATLIFLLVWNVIAPLFDLPILDFWQAFAFLVIIEIIGSAFRSRSGS